MSISVYNMNKLYIIDKKKFYKNSLTINNSSKLPMTIKNLLICIMICTTITVQANFFEKKTTRQRRIAYHSALLATGIFSGLYFMEKLDQLYVKQKGILSTVGNLINKAFTIRAINQYPFLSSGFISAVCIHKGFKGLRKDLKI